MVTESSAGVPRQLHMSDGEQDYSVMFDNETSPGRTEVGIDGMDQEKLLMDVTTSFSEMGISVESARLQSQNNRILDIFLVSDMESNTAIPENKWPFVKDRILAKLKRRKIVNTSHDDPKLVEQVHKNITLIDTGYYRYISMRKAIKAKLEL